MRVDKVRSGVAYVGLPMSSGGAHRLGRTSAQRAINQWSDFLSSRTAASPPLCSLHLSVNPQLGPGRRLAREIGRVFPPTLGAKRDFSVPPERITEAAELFDSFTPVPMTRAGLAAVSLSLGASFRILQPGTTDPWPEQDPARFGHFRTPAGVTLGASSARLTMDGTASMSLLLSVPNASDQDLAVLVPWLQEALPLRLSAKHWTRWTLTADERSYRGSRIIVPV